MNATFVNAPLIFQKMEYFAISLNNRFCSFPDFFSFRWYVFLMTFRGYRKIRWRPIGIVKSLCIIMYKWGDAFVQKCAKWTKTCRVQASWVQLYVVQLKAETGCSSSITVGGIFNVLCAELWRRNAMFILCLKSPSH